MRLTRDAGWKRSRRQLAELQALADQHGLSFSREPTIDFECFDFHLFRFMTDPEWANMLHGSWRGLPVAAADYRQLSDPPDPNPHSDYRWSVVVSQHDLSLPHLLIESKSRLHRAADQLLDPLNVLFKPIDRLLAPHERPSPKLPTSYPVELDAEVGRKRFVSCPDDRLAKSLIDARMGQWLLGPGAPYSFELLGRHVLTYRKRLEPDKLPDLFDAAAEFHTRIPVSVRSVYRDADAEESS